MKSSQTSSIRPERPLWRVYLPLALLTLASACLSLMLGPVSLSPGEVISALFRSEAVTAADRIALYARLPRTCAKRSAERAAPRLLKISSTRDALL